MEREFITLYENPDYTGIKQIDLDDMTHIGYTTGYPSKVEVEVDGTKFYRQDLSGNITTMPSDFTEPLVQYSPGGQGVAPIIPDMHNKVFYFKPNMKFTVNMYVENNSRLIWNVRFEVNNQQVAYEGDTIISTPLPARAIRFGLFKSRPDDEISVGCFVITGSNETMHTGSIEVVWLSENFWDGSFNGTTKSPSSNATPGSRGGARVTTSDVIDPGTAFNHINVLARGGNGIHIYMVHPVDMHTLYREMFSRTILGFSENKYMGFNSGLLACHYLPIELSGVPVIDINVNGFPLGPVTSTVELTQQTYATDWFRASLPARDFVGNSFLDFAPYVTASLILPFIGVVSLDVNKIMYGEVRVRYIIDLLSGNCLAEVYVTDLDDNPLFFSRYAGNCAYTVPLFANESGGYPILGLFEGVAGASLGVAAAKELVRRAPRAGKKHKGKKLSVPYIVEKNELRGEEEIGDAVEDMANWEANTAMIGTLPHNVSALAGNYTIALTLTIKNSLTLFNNAEQDMLKALFGYSASFYCKLAQLKDTGFVSGEFHADNVPKATEPEKEEIEKLLKEGVYL